MCFFLYINPVI